MAGNGWTRTTIGDVCEGIFDGPHATPKKTDSGPTFLGISSLVNGRLDLSDTEHLSEGDYARWTKRITPQSDDIVFSYETRLGEAARIPNGLRCCLGRRMALMRPNKNKINPRFLLFLFLSPPFQDLIRARTVHGSTVDRIPLLDFPHFPITIPSLDVQNSIAHSLGTLDDKIELNRRMNETLEGMARAIFKSWFVDFDPVHAKMNGRPPEGMDAATAKLFPDSFEDSELGKIPKGWKVRCIESLCELITSGGTPARMNKAYWDNGTIPWFKTGELLDGALLESGEKITTSGLESSSCKLWPAGTILFALYASPTVGRLGILIQPGTANQAAAALIPKPSYGTQFLVSTLLEARARLQQISVGAAQQNINQGVLKSHEVIAPPAQIAKAFSELMEPLWDKRVKLAEESRTLAALRDALLPKLLSGEIPVSET